MKSYMFRDQISEKWNNWTKMVKVKIMGTPKMSLNLKI